MSTYIWESKVKQARKRRILGKKRFLNCALIILKQTGAYALTIFLVLSHFVKNFGLME